MGKVISKCAEGLKVKKSEHGRSTFFLDLPNNDDADGFNKAESQMELCPKIDPEVASQEWFYGRISRDRAQNLLLRFGTVGSYLVRFSETNPDLYALSFRDEDCIKHFRIDCKEGKDCKEYSFEKTVSNKRFISIQVLLNHYIKKNRTLSLKEHIIVDEVASYEILARRITNLGISLGTGNSSTVVQGKWNDNVDVALKEFREEYEAMAQNEISILRKLNNPNIVSFFGQCEKDHKTLIVLEYMEKKSLSSYLKGLKNGLDLKTQLIFSKSIAKGMLHLSGLNIIHRDLAARNILVGKNNELKISDFGISKQLKNGEDCFIDSSIKVPLKWAAPEVLTGRIFSIKSDVWSFGVTLYEICSKGSEPYKGMSPEEVTTKMIDDATFRLTKPSKCEDQMYEIMNYCWDTDRNKRHTFDGLDVALDDYYQTNEAENSSDVESTSENDNYSSTDNCSNSDDFSGAEKYLGAENC